MSITKSIEFYAGDRTIKTRNIFGGYFMNYEFCKDIAYTDISFQEAANELKHYMIQHNIKVAYCDISADFGGGYSLFKRYTFINKSGTFITKKQRYDY